MQKDRNHWIDIAKAILIIFTILLHYPWRNGENNSFIFRFMLVFTVPMFMYISGYVSTLSFSRKGIDSLEKAYATEDVVAKFLRFAIPFTMAFGTEWILFRVNRIFIVNVFEYGLLAFVKDWIVGGYGMGSYYFPIMIQFIFIFPLIYFYIRKNGIKGMWMCFVMNLAYELIKSAFHMNEYEYRLLIFRYLFIIAAGCYMALNGNKKRKIWPEVVQLLVGLGFIILFNDVKYEPRIIVYWGATSVLTCLYVIPIMNVVVKINNIKIPVIEYVGKATFNIMLIQMIYFCVYVDRINMLVTNPILNVVVTILICVGVGLVFYFVENKFTAFVIKRITNLLNRNESI